jgi:hypothetical protein
MYYLVYLTIIATLIIIVYSLYCFYAYHYINITQVTDNIYLGNLKDANNHILLKKLGITKVISVIDLPVK